MIYAYVHVTRAARARIEKRKRRPSTFGGFHHHHVQHGHHSSREASLDDVHRQKTHLMFFRKSTSAWRHVCDLVRVVSYIGVVAGEGKEKRCLCSRQSCGMRSSKWTAAATSTVKKVGEEAESCIFWQIAGNFRQSRLWELRGLILSLNAFYLQRQLCFLKWNLRWKENCSLPQRHWTAA